MLYRSAHLRKRREAYECVDFLAFDIGNLSVDVDPFSLSNHADIGGYGSPYGTLIEDEEESQTIEVAPCYAYKA